MEIVFASSDRDQTSFDEYYADMPWCAVPYEKRDIKVGSTIFIIKQLEIAFKEAVL